jgi:hypothetical protein
MHLHEHALVVDARHLDLAELEHVRRAIPFLDDGLHVTVRGVVQMGVDEAAILPREG